MRKKLISRIIILAMFFIMVVPTLTAHAVGDYQEEQHVYVHDLAGLLSSSEEQELKGLAESYCENFNLNVLFLTTDDAKNKSTMVYSDDYMDALFPTGVENNIAFVIDMDNREYYINTMGIAIEKLDDVEIEQALDRGWSYMLNGDYAGAFKAMAKYCLADVTSGWGSTMLSLLTASIPFALIITAITIVVLITRHNAANKTQSGAKYLSKENYTIVHKDEIFVRSYETVQKDYYRPKSSSSGCGSSHSSSSGRSHGGGGRRF